MRERLAQAIAVLLTGLVVLLAAFFADQRNQVDARADDLEPVEFTPAPATAQADPALVARGRTIYEEQACSRCHTLEGRGNPRSPLDGVGSRRSTGDLRAGVTGGGRTGEELTRSTLRTKERFAQLPQPELDALVAFLSSLR